MLIRPKLLLVLSLLMSAGACSTDASKYRVGSTGALQTRAQAQQTHMKSTAATAGQPDEPLKPISTPFPEYPSSLRNDGIVGKVRVRFIVESDGTVSNPVVLGSAPAELVAITLHSITQWRFEPPLRGGKPERVAVEQAFVFELD
jgi:TonB family protein